MYKLGKCFGTSLMAYFFSLVFGVTLSGIAFWYFRNEIDEKQSALIGILFGTICHFVLSIYLESLVWQAL
jgi:hypothetical protein